MSPPHVRYLAMLSKYASHARQGGRVLFAPAHNMAARPTGRADCSRSKDRAGDLEGQSAREPGQRLH
jgi:hypothetical protein